jgi:hypothetical protein
MEVVGVAGSRDALAILPLAFFTIEPGCSPKIEREISKSPPISIMLSDATAAASAGGSGVPLSLSSDQSPVSDIVFLVDCTFHAKIQKRKVVVRGQEGVHVSSPFHYLTDVLPCKSWGSLW